MVSEADLIEIQRLAQEDKIGQTLIYVENLGEKLYRAGFREGWDEGYTAGIEREGYGY